MNELKVVDLGLMNYQKALEIQNQFHQHISKSSVGVVVLCVEHPDVLTVGKHADQNNILDQQRIDVVQIDRGGDVTAHMPGQLVVYPIANIAQLNIGPRQLICILEKSIIQTLKSFGLVGFCKTEYPGVWVENRKIAAVGVRIKNRTSLHGLSLNVNNRFDVFEKIIPCGIKEFGVTSLERELNKQIEIADVKLKLLENLCENFAKNKIKMCHIEEILQ